MRPLLTLLFLCLFPAWMLAQSPDPAFISSRLLDRMESMPDAQHDFYVLLADRVDAESMLNRFQAEGTPLAERTYQIVTQLQAKAEATQGPLLELMYAHPALVPGSVRALWVTNMITATGSAELIADLSRHPAVEWIEWNSPMQPDEYIREDCPAPALSPNGTEPGLEAINAPALWAMGYTGYGTISLTSDTGVDPWHPALYSKYRGIYTTSASEAFLGTQDIPFDCGDHGTHVTGTMVGLDRNSNDTIGVAFNAQWIGAPSISGCNNNGVSTFDAFQWALDPDGDPNTIDDMPAVVNNSWWSPGTDDECNSGFVDIFNALEAAGVAVVFSAGNSGPGASTITSPKNINTNLVNVFCVGNINAGSGSLPIANSSSRGPSICGGEGSLLIKPEVSAPGTSVRSSVTGGGYSNFTGTSMAAPHASGAILLLKEAFPEASGMDIKLALYFSATDLGEVGEDNVYGMGIINVESAYNYLIDEGFTPADPIAVNDLLFYDLRVSEIYCNGSVLSPEIRIENSGTTLIETFTVSYWLEGGTPFDYTWTGNLEPGERLSFNLPGQAVEATGNYAYVEITSVNGLADDRALNNRLYRPVETIDKDGIAPVEITTMDGTFCDGSPAFLRAEGDGPGTPVFSWYDVSEGGTPLATGDVFETPELNGPTTYYVDAEYKASIGMESPELGDTQVVEITDGQGIEFDVLQTLSIDSVWAEPNGTGPRIMEVRDSDGDLVSTRFINITENEPQWIPLDITLNPGEGYRLIVGGGLGFTYNVSGHEFPYDLEDYLRLTRSWSAFGGTQQIYYFFYNWQVSLAEACGRTPFEVAPAPAGTLPEALFSPVSTTVEVGQDLELTNSSSGADSWMWIFGNGDTSTEFEPSYSFDTPGTYTISLSASSGGGCTDVQVVTIEVTEETTTSTSFVSDPGLEFGLFPNPTTGIIQLSLPASVSEPVLFGIFDVSGRELRRGFVGPQQAQIDLSGLSDGMYLIRLQADGVGAVKKFVIQH